MNNLKIRVVIAIIFLLTGFIAGSIHGSYQAMKWVSKTALRFFESNDVEININAKELAIALTRYRHEIDKLYPK